MYKKNKAGILGIVIKIIILVLVVVFSNGERNTSFFENVANKLVMPIQNGLTYLKNKITGNNSFFSDVEHLKAENEDLKKKNSELEQSLREYEILKAENETLKEYVNLKDKYKEYSTVPGYVINRDISNYSNTIIINVGKNDGIEPNMTVISDRGLVGHILSVTDTTAKVQTIIDTASSVSSTMSTTRDTIIVSGTLDDKSMLKATLVQGDNVETSGLGGIYPKGIHIGTISQIVNTKNITDRYAMINPAVDFSKLETVLVITNK